MIQTTASVAAHTSPISEWFVGYRDQYEARLASQLYPSVLEVTVSGEFRMIVPDQDLSPAIFLSGTVPVRSIHCTLNNVAGFILSTIVPPEAPGSTRFVVVCTTFAVEPGPLVIVPIAFEQVMV